MVEWKCDTCGQVYDLSPSLLEREQKHHGPDDCGAETTQQRVTINTVNMVQREKIRSEPFAETLERLVREGLECRRKHSE